MLERGVRVFRAPRSTLSRSIDIVLGTPLALPVPRDQ
jgi:hypothetical protein